MSYLKLISNGTKGAVMGVAFLTALPLFGAVGTITVVGAVVGSVGGAALGIADTVNDERKGK